MLRALSLRTMATVSHKKKIEFYYDIFSPYSWFAFEVLVRYKKHWNMDLQLKPFLLNPVGKAAGNIGPMLVPNKAIYMDKDLRRSAKYFNVPFNMIQDPIDFILVKGSVIPNRFLIATDLLYPHHLEAASRAIWLEVWNKNDDFTKPEVLTRAGQECGMTQEEVNKVFEHTTHQDTKDLLRANTDQAIKYKAFGSPTIVAHVGGEPMMFFGSDRFPILAQEIGETWLGPEPDAVKPKL